MLAICKFRSLASRKVRRLLMESVKLL